MIWVLVFTAMGFNSPKVPDGAKIALARYETQAACEAGKAQLIEAKGPPPHESTLDCIKLEVTPE
jgi:hypothetical protein